MCTHRRTQRTDVSRHDKVSPSRGQLQHRVECFNPHTPPNATVPSIGDPSAAGSCGHRRDIQAATPHISAACGLRSSVAPTLWGKPNILRAAWIVGKSIEASTQRERTGLSARTTCETTRLRPNRMTLVWPITINAVISGAAVQHRQCRGERDDPRAAEALAKALCLADIERAQLSRGHLREVRNTRELSIVDDHGHAVGRQVHVDLDKARPERNGRAQRCKGVFPGNRGNSRAGPPCVGVEKLSCEPERRRIHTASVHVPCATAGDCDFRRNHICAASCWFRRRSRVRHRTRAVGRHSAAPAYAAPHIVRFSNED